MQTAPDFDYAASPPPSGGLKSWVRIEAPTHGVVSSLIAYFAIPDGFLSEAGKMVLAVVTAAISTVVSTLIQAKLKKKLNK